MTLKDRRGIWIALIVVGVLLLGLALKGMLFPSNRGPAVATAPVTMGDVEQTVLATGTLEPIELVSVGAQVSGQVTSLKVELGQQVKRGDLIAEIDSQPQQNALRTAQAQVDNARAQRRQAEATLTETTLAFDRQTQMLAADATSRADYEAARAALKTAQGQLAALDAQIAQATVSVETARVNLGYTRIVAPMDGTIIAIVTQEGQTVNANQAAPTIVKLGQLGTMTVKAEISEADVVRVHPGQDVYFTILGQPDQRRYAKLRTVEPAPESFVSETSSASASGSAATASAIYYNGLFDVPNPDGLLRTSMTAQVYIVLGQAKGVLTVPSAALGERARDGSYPVQVVLDNGKTERRRAKIGLNNNITAQVLSGLKAGDRVVVAEAGPSDQAQQGPGARGPGGRRRPGPFGF
ncbi:MULTISPECIES: efflux RND transporter periplasmic adaptor subunit [Phenylobacterium]|uniref:Macrolide-specific efflux system membrane fusion protein n=1 Tax=Phenylobacterium koreense TaxID=266125 RepID=A0ABV2EF58_9CAUL